MTTITDAYSNPASTQTAGVIFKHLLLPIDFSESNVTAARYTRQIARWGDSHVTLLHVKPPAAQSVDVSIDGTHVLDRVKRILGRASLQTVIGDPAHAISQYATESNVDLIVVPTRGVGAVRRFVLGSVTAQVLESAACPVLTISCDDGAPANAGPCIRHIVRAVDLGPDSLRIMQSADALAKRRGAAATMLHVSPQLEPAVGVVHDREWCSYLATVLRAEIGKLQREAGIEAAVRLAGGEPARTVAEMASDLNADLLVIGRPRPQGLLRRLRAHSYAIVSQTPCPVLSV